MNEKEGTTKFPWPRLGHRRVCQALENTISSGQIPHAYLFLGPEGIGKSTMAAAFARNLVASRGDDSVPDELPGSYADLIVIERQEGKKNISVEQVRELIHRLSLTSFLGSYKIGIIKDAQDLSLEGANALLKTLEEPSDNSVIILLAVSLDNIPSTIVSRCVLFRFQPVAREEVYDQLIAQGASRSQAKEISALSGGKPLLAQRYLEDKEAIGGALAPAENLLAYLEGGLMPSDAELDAWLGKGGFNEEAAAAERIFSVWQLLLRDLALVSLSAPELVGYSRFLSRLEAISRNIIAQRKDPSAYVARALRELDYARSLLSSNVGARRAIILALANIEI